MIISNLGSLTASTMRKSGLFAEVNVVCASPDTVAKLVKSFGSLQKMRPKFMTTFAATTYSNRLLGVISARSLVGKIALLN